MKDTEDEFAVSKEYAALAFKKLIFSDEKFYLWEKQSKKSELDIL
ncbi:hypothetical protein [Holospora curviuscula]|nr:hypothetical protein [Holospora curviuscula]